MSLSPSSPYVTQRAFAKKAKHDLDGAIADFTKAIELNPTDPDTKTVSDEYACAKFESKALEVAQPQ
jgi:hypothetical protein